MSQGKGPSGAVDEMGRQHRTTADFDFSSGYPNNPSCQERWRELFPLPWSHVPPAASGSSVSSRRRRAKVRNRVNEVNSLVDCLNEMYAGEAKQFSKEITEAQHAVHHSLFKQLSRMPTPSNLCTEREAIEELLHTSTSYEQENGSTVRPYDRSLMSLPDSGDCPVDLRKVLDPVGREYVEDPSRCMMLSEEEWGYEVEKGNQVRPYMDERLQQDPELYRQFIKDLADKGVISFTNRPIEMVTPFCVNKKNGKLRLILDCRPVNARFKKPPPLALGAGTSWSQLGLPEGKALFLAQSDIKDYFYSLALPESLQSLFCMPAVPANVAQAWKLPRLGAIPQDDEGWSFPMLRVVQPAGFGAER